MGRYWRTYRPRPLRRRRRFYRYPTRRRRYYTRRRWVRRHRRRFWRLRRRRRWGIKRRRQHVVVRQWNPSHRRNCKIRGWMPGIMSTAQDSEQKMSLLTQPKSGQKKLNREIQGGGVEVMVLSLDMLYDMHLLHWNTWSSSNEGFDLARYFGTKFKLSPHPTIPYIFTWESNWGIPIEEELPTHHPANLLLNKRKKIIWPRIWRGRSKKVFVKPPALQQSIWYTQRSWCGVGLLRFGLTPINFDNPFIHTNRVAYGVPIGWGALDAQTTFPPKPIANTIQGLVGVFTAHIMYRWWWDKGINNYVLMNKDLTPIKNSNSDPGWDALTVVSTNGLPYWEYFYGLKHLGRPKQTPNTSDSALPTKTTDTMCNTVAILWYLDVAIRMQGAGGPFYAANMTVRTPEQTSNQGKYVWVFLGPYNPSSNDINTGTISQLNYKWPTYDQIKTVLTAMSGMGPFGIHTTDISNTGTINICLQYTSYWQWGGQLPTPDSIQNPCPTSTNLVQVRDPRSVYRGNLHPWDLDKDGLITKDALRRLILEGTPQTSPRHQETSQRPLDPSRPTEDEPWQEEEDFNGSDSTLTTSSSSEESDQEATEDLPETHRRALQLLRERLTRRLKREQHKQRKLKHIIYKLAH
ncbi:MAG: ORF1 [Tettorquevirus sp.]|nr:MAG: ORF1 [Tettorquevirus sp.]